MNSFHQSHSRSRVVEKCLSKVLLPVSELVTEGRHKADRRDRNKGNCDVRAFLLCLLLIQFLFVFPLLLLVSRLESLETFIDQLKFEHTTLSSR